MPKWAGRPWEVGLHVQRLGNNMARSRAFGVLSIPVMLRHAAKATSFDSGDIHLGCLEGIQDGTHVLSMILGASIRLLYNS